MLQLKVIPFDLCGTVFDLRGTPREEVRGYLDCCTDRPWRAQKLPNSWKKLPAYPDSAEGVRRLQTKYKVVALSNLPQDWSAAMSVKAGIFWDEIIDLESIKTYKPDPSAYMAVCEMCGYEPQQVMMVTANPSFGPYSFGDIHMADLLGMRSQLIRAAGCPKTIIELAESLGC